MYGPEVSIRKISNGYIVTVAVGVVGPIGNIETYYPTLEAVGTALEATMAAAAEARKPRPIAEMQAAPRAV